MQFLCLLVIAFSTIQLSLSDGNASSSSLQILSYTDVSVKMKSFSELNTQFASVKQEMNYSLNGELKSLRKILQNFNTRLDKMGNVDANLTDCVANVREVLKKSPPGFPNVTSITLNAQYEKRHIYEKILQEIYDEGRRKIEKIANEIMKFGIENDCEDTDESCSEGILEMAKRLPGIYKTTHELTMALFSDFMYDYRDRVHDYVDEVKRSLKPYMIMADHCFHRYLMS